MRKSIMPDYEMVFNTIYIGSDRPNAATFTAWIDRAQRTRQALLENKRLHKADIDSMTGIWADEKIAERKTAYKADELELAKIARDKVRADLERVIAEKQKAYDRATGAPTTEQVNLINILEMRSKYEDLQPSDFANVVGKLADNYHALKMLGNIANKCNVAFPQLHDTFREDCDTARERVSTLLTEIDTPTDELSYLNRLFWEAGSAGIQQTVLNRLDSLSYLTTSAEAVEQAAIQPKVEEARESQNEKKTSSDICSKVRLTGLESISALADQFHVSRQQIQDLNPGKNLDNLHENMELYIPSTRFSYAPGNPSRVQQNQVTLAETPKFEVPCGPNGEQPGDDLSIL